MTNTGPMDWTLDGPTWPNHQASQFVTASRLRWHVQRMGTGPTLLLLHGTGASTHSWRDLMGPLSHYFDVIAPDLPGHGFTGPLPLHRLNLPGMAKAVGDLLGTLKVCPQLVVGHSAGAAIAVRMVLDHYMDPTEIISFSGALKPYGGAAGQIFSSLARLLFVNPLVPWVASRRAADPRNTAKVILNTGSRLSPEGLALYHRLFQSPAHISGALGMMAGWDLHGLNKDMKQLATPLLLIEAENDKAVPPSVGDMIAKRVPHGRTELLRHVGHLAHEENPAQAIEIILREGERLGLVSGCAESAPPPPKGPVP